MSLLGEEMKRLSQDIMRVCVLNDDTSLIEKLLDEDMTWMGVDKENLCVSKKDVLDYLNIYKKEHMDIEIRHEKYDVKKVNESVYNVLAHCNYSYIEIKKQISLTLLWVKKEDEWKLFHVHSSALDLDREDHLLDINKRLNCIDVFDSVGKTSIFDPLTNIFNNEGFENETKMLLNKYPKNKYVVIKFGIRNFRFINQRFGYQIGDKVLMDLAKNLQRSLGVSEACGRIEKDNFAMLYTFKNKDKLNQRMDRVRKKLISKRILKLINMELHLTAGIYIVERNESTYVKDMLDKALMALQTIDYSHAGSQFVYFEESMLKKQYQNSQLLQEAIQALNNNEFHVYIQPQFDILKQNIVAGEVLARWIRDGVHISGPDHFIPLFEKHGIIEKFDFYMLEKVCKLLREWIDAGTLISPISINQSRSHLSHKNYFNEFCAVVDKYQIPHHYIAFELTESTFVENSELVIKLANELHNHGFKLAIDDFGTGYASMNLLSVISADILKIDKSLLFESEENIRSKIIVEKIIEMAHKMDMIVICEGIETQRQLEFLKELNCDIGQGFLLGRPIDSSVFVEKWLIKNGERKI